MVRLLLALLMILGGASPPAQLSPFQPIEATIDDVQAALTSKQITCRALVAHYIRRIEAYDKSGPSLNAVQTINRRAAQDADRLDAAFARSGPVGPLHCVPLLIK